MHSPFLGIRTLCIFRLHTSQLARGPVPARFPADELYTGIVRVCVGAELCYICVFRYGRDMAEMPYRITALWLLRILRWLITQPRPLALVLSSEAKG